MSQIFKCNFLLLFLLTSTSTFAGALNDTCKIRVDLKEFYKEIKKEFPLEPNGTTDLSNRYGKVTINTWNENKTKFEVKITVNAPSQDDADEVFSRIHINFSNTPSYAKAETVIDPQKSSWWWGSSNSDYKIDYIIWMPKSAQLVAANKYGNLMATELNGKVTLDIKYGDFQLDGVNNDLFVTLGYGNGTVVRTRNVSADVKYSNLRIEQLNNAALETKYSKVFLTKAENVTTTSRYDTYKIGYIHHLKNDGKYDNFTIDMVDHIDVSTEYSDYRVTKMGKTINASFRYGNMRVNTVARDFEKIDLVGAYTDFKLQLASGTSCRVMATCKYASVNRPVGFSYIKDIDEGKYQELEGFIGTKGANATIRANLSYGGLSITSN